MGELDRFVEGKIISVRLNEVEKKVTILLNEPGGGAWSLVAVNVFDLMVLQMRMQNIIDRISVWTSGDDPIDYRDKLFVLFGGGERENQMCNVESVEREVGFIQGGGKILLEFEPVFGAIVLVLATELVLEKADS